MQVAGRLATLKILFSELQMEGGIATRELAFNVLVIAVYRTRIGAYQYDKISYAKLYSRYYYSYHCKITKITITDIISEIT